MADDEWRGPYPVLTFGLQTYAARSWVSVLLGRLDRRSPRIDDGGLHSLRLLVLLSLYLSIMPVIRPQNLNDVFQAVATQARQNSPLLTHNQQVGAVVASASTLRSPILTLLQVARLYRNSLKVLLSWVVDRDVFNDKATEIRHRFDANRGVNPAMASRLLKEGEDELFEHFHPDIYRNCYMPGGSKFMRNPPLPMDVCFPDGNLPADAPKYEVNPDMSVARPETGRNATGTVLVDFYKKNME